MPRRIESSTERTISRSPSSAARWSRKAITSGKLWPVSMCSSGNGKRPGRNAFSARRSSTSESLPPEKSSAGLTALARDLAQDVDRFGFEPAEVIGISRPERVDRLRRMRPFKRGFAHEVTAIADRVAALRRSESAAGADRTPCARDLPTTSGRRGRPRPA